MLKVFNFDFDVFILIESLLKVSDFSFVGLDLIVTVSQCIIKSLNLLSQLLILPVNIDIPWLLFFESVKFLLQLRYVELKLLTVLNQVVKFLLQSFFILFHIRIFIQPGLYLGVSIFPFLNFSESAF